MTGAPAAIGLEIHVQLATRTKLFCGDVRDPLAPSNTHVCPVCLGLPGSLPVLNAAAVELAVVAALALNCVVSHRSRFVRKHYFYPDLPRGYQITQVAEPLAAHGWLDVPADPEPAARVRIERVHLEEDAGKLVHRRVPGSSGVDLNRAGVALVEIVTGPDLRSPAGATRFLRLLRRTLRYAGISDCDMEHGSLRVDANVSLRHDGSDRCELKNLNSFSQVEDALGWEIRRLRRRAPAGPETRLWDPVRREARRMRAKEQAHDYRYIEDPDLPPLSVSPELIDRLRRRLPELPAERARRFGGELGLRADDAEVLLAEREVADYFEAVARSCGDVSAAAAWVRNEVLRWLNSGGSMDRLAASPEESAALVTAVRSGRISPGRARALFHALADGRTRRLEITPADERVQDVEVLDMHADDVVRRFPAEAARFRVGEHRVLTFLMGQLMRLSQGRADPSQAEAALRRRLAE